MFFPENGQDDFQAAIKRNLALYQQMLPAIYNKVNPQKTMPQNLDDMLGLLVNIFKYEEQTALSRSNDGNEGTVRMFAKKFMQDLLKKHAQLKENEKYKELCGTIYAAYGCFQVLFELIDMIDRPWDYLGKQYYKLLYLELVRFYDFFYINFYDNEDAIRFLCKFYPSYITDESKADIEKIADTLYTHISRAGTPNDFSYAYQGISTIEKYISNLSENVILAILGKYSIYQLVYNKVFRHQLLSIIKCAGLDEKTQRRLKFLCLDSLQIVYNVNMLYSQKLMEKNKEADFSDNYDDCTLSDKEMKIFNEKDLHWNNAFIGERTSGFAENWVLFNDGEAIFKIELSENENEVVVSNEREKSQRFCDYDMNDWLLDNYKEKKKRELLKKLVYEESFEKKDVNMFLSLAYLDGYRGLNHQVIDFDHKFVYQWENNALAKNSDDVKRIPHFYGKSVYSLSCIVGRNATGKTSIVDFLRESFFILLKYIKEQRITCKNGYVSEVEYDKYKLLDKGAKFMVIFSLGEQFYYLTNIECKKRNVVEDVKPFSRRAYEDVNELSKVAYFSNQLRNDQKELLLEKPEELLPDGIESDISPEEMKKNQKIQQTNMDFRMADYSEKKSFIIKRRALEAKKKKNAEPEEITLIDKGINKDICYQLYFLKKYSLKEVGKLIDMEDHKVLKLSSWWNNVKEEVTLEGLKTGTEFEEYLRGIIGLPDTTIEHFSTGQYAKFSFLAKLYWFLNGSEGGIEYCNDLAGDYVFSNEEVLQKDETAIIFIDEGETYYHPEWQRQYIELLLQMVNADLRKVQIVVTTNSPFMISDILGNDIVYLSKGKDKDTTEPRRDECTLGQNIHTLLKKNFFMNYTIGEYAKNLIDRIIFCLQKDSLNLKDEIKNELQAYFEDIENYYDAIHLLIEQIGEPVYKVQLEEMLENSPVANQKNDEFEMQIRELEKEKQMIQKKINALKERN